MTRAAGAGAHSQSVPEHRRRTVALATPLYALVPAGFGLAFRREGVPLRWPAVGAGALGWTIALGLRAPVALLATRVTDSPERASPWVVAVSGPAEETTRAATLRLAGPDRATALSVGLGWASIEVLYAVVTGFALAALAERDDEEARQARELLAAQGRSAMLDASAPLVGVLERASASALHIGFTLLVARDARLALLTAPVHSAVNLAVVRLLRRGVGMMEVILGAIGFGILALGLALAPKNQSPK